MGYVLTGGGNWNGGYRLISLLQIALTVVLVLSLPLWKHDTSEGISNEHRRKALSLSQILHIPGAKAVMLCFFCYCAVEQTVGLWAASYLTLHKGISADTAAGYASLFFVGITVGRALGGFLTLKLNDGQMIRLGQSFVLAGILFLFLPFGGGSALAGLILIGLGCAPIYPSIIHSTPERFGADKSQAIIGVQMASAYVGTCVMPPVFGVIANHISVSLLPVYLLLILALTPHMLRHTYITNLIHSSVDPKTVQYLAGHESSKITLDIYAKVKYNRPDELAGVLSGAFAQWDAGAEQ